MSLTEVPNSLEALRKEQEYDPRQSERFHLYPKDRIEALATTSGLIGLMSGFYDGVQKAAARYLLENGHRLPKTKGGWYFYHKRKNYEIIVGGTSVGIKRGLKYGGVVGSLFLLEYSLDSIREQVDFINTTVAALIGTTVYTRFQHLSRLQTRKMIVRGTTAGLLLGIIQDSLIYARSGHVWYIDEYKRRLK
ncbi:hypothetical protein CANMA_002908 [Candida margitis]|uniref:uncharacterized protein n=1 Tax=Candida margitis TaxID=1775924 RepID=UPI0022277C81|nr:uncharacterized protein CANMA_002908 [Candida margitis]KAI5967728.1 hypothetical protein CANMA_002908 [Candida margitis]